MVEKLESFYPRQNKNRKKYADLPDELSHELWMVENLGSIHAHFRSPAMGSAVLKSI